MHPYMDSCKSFLRMICCFVYQPCSDITFIDHLSILVHCIYFEPNSLLYTVYQLDLMYVN